MAESSVQEREAALYGVENAGYRAAIRGVDPDEIREHLEIGIREAIGHRALREPADDQYGSGQAA